MSIPKPFVTQSPIHNIRVFSSFEGIAPLFKVISVLFWIIMGKQFKRWKISWTETNLFASYTQEQSHLQFFFVDARALRCFFKLNYNFILLASSEESAIHFDPRDFARSRTKLARINGKSPVWMQQRINLWSEKAKGWYILNSSNQYVRFVAVCSIFLL